MKKPMAALALAAALTAGALAGCSGEPKCVGTWYACDDDGDASTLTVDGGGTWSFSGEYTASGDWTEQDDGTVVLSGANGMVTIPMKVEGDGDSRSLSFAGDDPMSVKNGGYEISTATFYASEEAASASAG